MDFSFCLLVDRLETVYHHCLLRERDLAKPQDPTPVRDPARAVGHELVIVRLLPRLVGHVTSHVTSHDLLSLLQLRFSVGTCLNRWRLESQGEREEEKRDFTQSLELLTPSLLYSRCVCSNVFLQFLMCKTTREQIS